MNNINLESFAVRDSLHSLYDKVEKSIFKDMDSYSFDIPKTKLAPRKKDCDCEEVDLTIFFQLMSRILKEPVMAGYLSKRKKFKLLMNWAD